MSLVEIGDEAADDSKNNFFKNFTEAKHVCSSGGEQASSLTEPYRRTVTTLQP